MKKAYRKVQASIKREIRYRFELGEDLLSLADEYKLNYGTLKNCSYKEEWEKGIQSDILYLEEAEENNGVLKEELGSIIKSYRNIRKVYLNETIETTKNKTLKPKVYYETVLLREKALALGYEMDSKLYNIRTDIEEKQHELLKAKVSEAYLDLYDIQQERDRTAKDKADKADKEVKKAVVGVYKKSK